MSGIKYGTLRDMAETANKYGPRIFQVKLLASPAAVALQTAAEQAITVTGLAAGDIVLTATKPTAQAGLALTQGRTGVNTWYPNFANVATSSVTPTAAEVYDLLILRPPQ